MEKPDRLAEVLSLWHEQRARGELAEEELLRANPELADELRASFESLHLLESWYPGTDTWSLGISRSR